MDFRNVEETTEAAAATAKGTDEPDRSYFGTGNDSEETDFKVSHPPLKDGKKVFGKVIKLPNNNSSNLYLLTRPTGGTPTTVPAPPAAPPKLSEVRNGDLVSLLLAATPPYLYNIPLVPQTFFFSEMLKSFVQAKAERQNLKMQQTQSRRQRKRTWREATPPKSISHHDSKDKPLELTTSKHYDEKLKGSERGTPGKKAHADPGPDRKSGKFTGSNFSVEKLANSSIAAEPDVRPGDVTAPGHQQTTPTTPPPPPLWYPLLYPPHPTYGIDPLHFFIDFRVSAEVWDRKSAAPDDVPGSGPLGPCPGPNRHKSAFTVPGNTPERLVVTDPGHRRQSRNVHYVASSLRDIYERARSSRSGPRPEEEVEVEVEEGVEKSGGEAGEGEKRKNLRALIDLELVVDYFKRDTEPDDGDDDDGDDGDESDRENRSTTSSVKPEIDSQ